MKEFFVSSVEFCKFEFNDTRDNETGTQGPTGPTCSVDLQRTISYTSGPNIANKDTIPIGADQSTISINTT